MLRGYRSLVDRSNPSVVEMYSKVAWIAAITWGLYPLVFIFSEGTGDWSPNFEIMIYAVLDIMSKVVFGFVLLLSHDGLDRITNFKSFAPIREICQAPSYGTQMTKAPNQMSAQLNLTGWLNYLRKHLIVLPDLHQGEGPSPSQDLVVEGEDQEGGEAGSKQAVGNTRTRVPLTLARKYLLVRAMLSCREFRRFHVHDAGEAQDPS
eukprot:749658-Hanusia_phi.AAC.3